MYQPRNRFPIEFSAPNHNLKDRSTNPRGSSFNEHTERYAAQNGCPSEVTSSGGSVSNLRSFLEHTTPTVSPQFLSKTRARDLSVSDSTSPQHFFCLSDLWDSFDEWSAYGAGVPVLLSGKEKAVQYYVPYLSALQLYTSPASILHSKNRRLGDDSDSSEMDFRDSSSEASSDSEAEKVLRPDNRTCSLECGGNSTLSRGKNFVDCRHAPWSFLNREEGLRSDEIWQGKDSSESLHYQFFETAVPSLRVPFYDKILELARQFPALKTLRSSDLSRSSWLSVAWYPIYRIPIGPTLKDLAASFLTYHRLSTLLADDIGVIPGIISQDFCHSDNKVALHPFGLASYKFRGSIWTSVAGEADHHYDLNLRRSSGDWLKGLHVHHPDYEYFMSHSLSVRH